MPRPSLAPWTVRGYVSKVETHIRPALGNISLAELTPDRLDTFYCELLAPAGSQAGIRPSRQGGRSVHRRALSPQTIKHIHAIIHRACEQGCRWGLVAHNPAPLAQPPRVQPRE